MYHDSNSTLQLIFQSSATKLTNVKSHTSLILWVGLVNCAFLATWEIEEFADTLHLATTGYSNRTELTLPLEFYGYHVF